MGLPKGRTNNLNGRPRNPEVEQFREALEKAEKKGDYSLLEHAVARAYKSDAVLVAVLKKILPDKMSSQIDMNEITSQVDKITQAVLKHCSKKVRQKIAEELKV